MTKSKNIGAAGAELASIPAKPLECSILRRSGVREKVVAIKEFKLDNGTRIGIFQGELGQRPDLDIIIKYKEAKKGALIRTPKHIHWAIDLLVKKQHKPELTKEFISYFIDMWNKVQPFNDKVEQQACRLICNENAALAKFRELDAYGEYKVDFLSIVMELMILEEKTGFPGAYMFKKVLESILNDKSIFTMVSSATLRKRG